ncbi:glutathionylspermidine synthase family protein [Aggregatibacter actinomycetemcomitans]|nr:glutathionylspermidine synthase family protein [Aggregatibacter actinomycetemcomitans]
MKRITGLPTRPNMAQQLMDVGFDYYNLPSNDGSHYWSDNVAYEFTLAEIDKIEDAANELHAMCMDFVADEIKQGDYAYYRFTELQKNLIEQSWRENAPHLYGRFDLGYDGEHLKMFEYNADTPTSLLEAAVVQWQWLEQVEGIPNRDQFNWIHEELITRFSVLQQQSGKPHFHFAAMSEAGREDWGNLDYLADVAYHAGWHIHRLSVKDIGYDKESQQFVDLNNQPIEMLFKLYPLEWMTTADYAPYMLDCATQFFEPAWKLLLSNKVLLAKLWQKHPNHPLLLASYFNKHDIFDRQSIWVKKPILGREGANVFYYEKSNNLEFAAKGSEHSNFYANSGYIYQQKFELPKFDGMYPVIGAWVVGDVACGMGLREDFTAVTGNDSHFVPHYFVE